MTVTLPLPFRASRVLLQGNPLLAEPGVALDVVGIELEPRIHAGWRRRVVRVARHLGWPAPRIAAVLEVERRVLSFTAPQDQLQTAREANEWALCACVVRRDPGHWSAVRDALRAAAVMEADPCCPCLAAEIDERAALARLRQLSQAEARARALD